MEAKYQVVGVSDVAYAEIIGQVLIETGSKKVVVVCGEDGMDEATILGDTFVFEFQQNQKMKKYKISPEEFGLSRGTLEEIKGGDAEFNKEILKKIFDGKGSEAQNSIVALNAGLSLWVFGNSASIGDGVKKALDILKSGRVADKLEEIIKYN